MSPLPSCNHFSQLETVIVNLVMLIRELKIPKRYIFFLGITTPHRIHLQKHFFLKMDKRSNVILSMFFKHFFFLFFKLHSSSSWCRLSEKLDLVLSPFWDGVILKNKIRKTAFIWLHIIWLLLYSTVKKYLPHSPLLIFLHKCLRSWNFNIGQK